MLGKRLRQARLEARVSQADLAGGRFSRSYVSEIERGRISPSSENLQFLAERLGKPLSYFLPSAQEEDDLGKKAVIDRIQSLAMTGQSSEAMALAQSLEPCLDSLSPANKANFLRITAWMQYNAGHLLTAITRSFQASGIYAQLVHSICYGRRSEGRGSVSRGWELCKYTQLGYCYPRMSGKGIVRDGTGKPD